MARQDGQERLSRGPGEGAVVPQLSLPPTSSLTAMPCRALRGCELEAGGLREAGCRLSWSGTRLKSASTFVRCASSFTERPWSGDGHAVRSA